MNEEELKQKADEWISNNTICYGGVSVLPTKENAYIAGYNEATNELKEKMSNCMNCLYWKNKNRNKVCRRVKRLDKTCCAFWKLKE